MGDLRKHPSPHHPADGVRRDLEDLCGLGDRVDRRLLAGKPVQVGTEAATDGPLHRGLDQLLDAERP
ncbi:MAG: hypothetical protein M0020_02655, partial [Actinomycetota bacterium]|nr:hypothetical protein [Actinomycetota bacterium]